MRDLAGEFASEHARIANRFGLDADTCADPHVEWLMDGFAFLTARVQQKLDGDYAVLTQHLLEMIYPDYLAPTPAAGIVVLEPAPDAPPLENGFTVPQGSRLQSRIVPGESSRCIFTTAHPVTVWPIELAEARYLTAAAVAALGLAGGGRAQAGILPQAEDQGGGVRFAGLALDRLVLHLAGRDRVAHLLYEALVGHACGLAGRPENKPDDAVALGAAGRVSRVGFSEEEALFPPSPRGFSGFRLLREYFTLPERFLFVALDGLRPLVRRADGGGLELVVLLDRFEPALDGVVTKDQFALFATPAVNLFPRRAKPIQIEPQDEQHHVVVDRARPLDHEVFAVDPHGQASATDGQRVGSLQPVLRRRARASAAAGARRLLHGRTPAAPARRERRSARASPPRAPPISAARSGWSSATRRRRRARPPACAGWTSTSSPPTATCRSRLPLPRGRDPLLGASRPGPLAGARVLGALARPKPSLAAVEPEGGGVRATSPGA